MSKISQILLSNFKFFNKEEVIDINNNHLLLYGENGSGKSSLFWGIYTLLEASFKQPIETDKYFQAFGTNDNGVYIFCHKDSSTSKSIEHIIPESLGNKDYFLPAGYVCDECNHYFAIKVEKELLSQPYFVSMRSRNEILTKKGKFVREKMIFPGALKSCEVEMRTTRNGLMAAFNDTELYELIKAGKIRTMISSYIPEPECPNTIMSRFLAKCAYEYFLYIMGKDKYNLCVQELLGSKIDTLKDLREYARYGKGKDWQYNQRRIYSEGDCFINQSENIHYEILHEMKFLTAEYKRYPNGKVEAEIYFIICIAGIEYAICISDSDISGYQKWLEKHNGISPLTDETETLIFSLSNVNSILIKKDDDRIY